MSTIKTKGDESTLSDYFKGDRGCSVEKQKDCQCPGIVVK